MIQVKRVYEPPEAKDGERILVDRLWPRGLSKEKADIGLWLKNIAPSTALRRWFGHDPAKWNEFRTRYLEELKTKEAERSLLKEQLNKGKVTLVYAAKDEQHNEAQILRELFSQ